MRVSALALLAALALAGPVLAQDVDAIGALLDAPAAVPPPVTPSTPPEAVSTAAPGAEASPAPIIVAPAASPPQVAASPSVATAPTLSPTPSPSPAASPPPALAAAPPPTFPAQTIATAPAAPSSSVSDTLAAAAFANPQATRTPAPSVAVASNDAAGLNDEDEDNEGGAPEPDEPGPALAASTRPPVAYGPSSAPAAGGYAVANPVAPRTVASTPVPNSTASTGRVSYPGLAPGLPAPRYSSVTRTTRIDDLSVTPDRPLSSSELAYEGRIRNAFSAATNVQGPLEGRWVLSGPTGQLYQFQVADRGARDVEGVWRDLTMPPGALNSTGLIDILARDGDALTVRFSPRGRAPVVLTLRATGPGQWSGQMSGHGDAAVSLRRN